ncbi:MULTISPECIES: hypothetical protein [Bacillaceae]|uniref:hypothetical protein n=1 Tax=Bacillaceae TaxID=186817 RepID=UPI000BED0426|nr:MULTISPECIES: hypothetical protein [unclassified Bacillus (in: firmicutes)]PEC51121.1 hypothetical protein CON00_03535 [Bacillus sp. AFS096315]PFM81288.1 hypothetical protein COJ46_10235 [Bacillus sp. AFS077874]
MNQQYIFIGIILLLLVYRIFKRFRRSIGWQQLNKKRILTSTVIFFIIGALILFQGGLKPIILTSDVAGILIGIGLAYFASIKTNFENRNGAWFYHTNIWISGTVTLLFFGRLVYRIYDIYSIEKLNGLQNDVLTNRLQSMASGWSAGLMLIMFAYYIVFNLYMIRKEKTLAQANNDFPIEG